MDETLNDYRRRRLQELANLPEIGGQAGLGERLGHKSGAQVGHMLSGRRPITEKTIARIESMSGGRYVGWFSRNEPSRARPAAAPEVAPWPLGEAVSPSQWQAWVLKGGAVFAATQSLEALRMYFDPPSSVKAKQANGA